MQKKFGQGFEDAVYGGLQSIVQNPTVRKTASNIKEGFFNLYIPLYLLHEKNLFNFNTTYISQFYGSKQKKLFYTFYIKSNGQSKCCNNVNKCSK